MPLQTDLRKQDKKQPSNCFSHSEVVHDRSESKEIILPMSPYMVVNN